MFSNLSRIDNMLDPAHVYTMEFYEDKLLPTTWELLLGPWRLNLARHLSGGTPHPQPLQMMAKVNFIPHSHDYLFNVELWHEKLFMSSSAAPSAAPTTTASKHRRSASEPLPGADIMAAMADSPTHIPANGSAAASLSSCRGPPASVSAGMHPKRWKGNLEEEEEPALSLVHGVSAPKKPLSPIMSPPSRESSSCDAAADGGTGSPTSRPSSEGGMQTTSPQQQVSPQQHVSPEQQVSPQQQVNPQQQVSPQQHVSPLQHVSPQQHVSPRRANPNGASTIVADADDTSSTDQRHSEDTSDAAPATGGTVAMPGSPSTSVVRLAKRPHRTRTLWSFARRRAASDAN